MRFDSFPFSPQLIQALWVLGRLPSEQMPEFAQAALVCGHDGRTVRRIAGLQNPTLGDLQPLFSAFLADLGIDEEISDEEAGWLLIRIIAKAISESRVKPYDGARFIWEVVNELWPNQQHPLLTFVGLASEYEDCESYSNNPARTRREIEKQIVEEARSLS